MAWVQDDDPEVLRHMEELGLMPGNRIKVLDQAPLDGPLTVCVDGHERVVGRRVAQKIFVVESPPRTPNRTTEEE